MGVLSTIKSWFGFAASLFDKFVESVFPKAINEVGEKAYEAVWQAERHAKPGDNKFEFAYEIFIRLLGQNASKYSLYLLQTAIQVAVGVLKHNGKEIKENK